MTAISEMRMRGGRFSIGRTGVDFALLLGFLGAASAWGQVSGTQQLSRAETSDDFPSVCAAKGVACVAWIASDVGESPTDRVVARVRTNGAWGDEEAVDATPGRRYRTASAVDAKGRPLLVWTAERASGWNLMMSRRDRVWSKPIELTSDSGPNIHPRLVSGPKGAVWIAWQRFEGRNCDVFLARIGERTLENITQISDDPASDWDPDLAIDSTGRVHVAWDSYRTGDYDVLYRRVDSSGPSPVRRIAGSSNFEAHVSIACDGQDRVWFAWDDGGPDWGKDMPGNGGWKTGAWKSATLERPQVAGAKDITTRMGGLHRVDGFRVARLTGDRLERPAADFEASLPASMRGATEFPKLVVDGEGRVSALFRFNPRTPYSPNKTLGARPKRVWTAFARTLTDEGWSDPVELPDSGGRNHHIVDATVDPNGCLLCAYASDGRTEDILDPKSDDVRVAAYTPKGSPPEAFTKAPTTAGKKDGAFTPPTPATWTVAGKTYRLYRGDLHRHTELSGDGSWDGSLLDLFRYGLDAAAMDFIAITDHGYGTSDYMWWHAQKMTDVFRIDGHFVPIHGYERSMQNPNAHRNIFTVERGYRATPAFVDTTLKSTMSQAEWKKFRAGNKVVAPDDTVRMWKAVRDSNAVTIPHTIGNTDWKDNDYDLEPLMEIYQGCRNSYEGVGSPKITVRNNPNAPLKGSAWEALGKGYRIGFIASSDHRSTHISYANLWATELSRPALFEAMRARRAFGSTETLTARTTIAGAPTGSEIALDKPPTIEARVEGTTDLRRVDVIKDGEVVYSASPGKPVAEFTFTDTKSTPGVSYYYLRALQEDEQIAWVSPIWVERK